MVKLQVQKNKVFFIDIEGVNERADEAYKEIADAVKNLLFVTKDSNTLELTKAASANGSENILSGNVKVADSVIINHKEAIILLIRMKMDFILMLDMTYDNVNKVLKFKVNERETDITLPVVEDAL